MFRTKGNFFFVILELNVVLQFVLLANSIDGTRIRRQGK